MNPSDPAIRRMMLILATVVIIGLLLTAIPHT
jgi:hypothetical protein